MKRRIAAFALLAFATATALPSRGHAGPLPGWAEAAANMTVPAWADSHATVVLLDEQSVSVPPRGRQTLTRRQAIAVRTGAGEADATGGVIYSTATDRLVSIRGWLIDPAHRVRALGKDQITTAAVFGAYTLYTDQLSVVLKPEDAPPGSVLVWESVVESEPLFGSWIWVFDDDVPVLSSRWSITLPPGDSPRARTFGAGAIPASHEGATWTWSMDHMPARRPELWAPAAWSGRTSLYVEVPGGRAGATFDSWAAAGGWLARLCAAQARVTPELMQRGGELAPEPSDTLRSMRAIAHFASHTTYVGTSRETGRGMGMRPRAASEVLRAGYGDCKDLANLARALFATRGYDAWLLAVNAGDRTRTDTLVPMAGGFDHCIVAVRVPDGTDLPAAFDHPALGRLVAFDATDADVPFGELPAGLQGSPALVQDSLHGGLVRLPFAPRAHDRSMLTLSGRLDATGALDGTAAWTMAGSEASDLRMLRRFWTKNEQTTFFEKLMNANVVRLSLARAEDDSVRNTTSIVFDARADHLARRMSDGQLALKLTLPPVTLYEFSRDTVRTLPIALPALHESQRIELTLPAGTRVEGLPPAWESHTSFGHGRSTWEVTGERLVVTRELVLEPQVLPASRAAEVRAFDRGWQAAQRATALLRP